MARHLISRTMATLTRQTQTITRTAEGAVAISYSNLVSAPLSLVDAIGMSPPNPRILLSTSLKSDIFTCRGSVRFRPELAGDNHCPGLTSRIFNL